MPFSQQCTHSATHRSSFKHNTCPINEEDPPLSLLCQSPGRMWHAGSVRFPVIGREPTLIMLAASVYVWILKKGLFCNTTKKNTSTEEIGLPSTSETAGENESDVSAVGPTAVKDKRTREKTRKYRDNYLKFGFTFKETVKLSVYACQWH